MARRPDPVLAAFALRRLRARRWGALGGAVAVAAAVGLLLAVSVLGALAREESARSRVAELAPRERLVQVVAREEVRGALRGLGLGPPATVRVAGPVSPSDERGTRLVHADPPPAGRAPRGCCEVLALGPRPRVGEPVRLGRVRARVVGRTALPFAPPERVLRGNAVLVGDGFPMPREAWVVASATLRPGAVPGTALGALAERMRTAAARVERLGGGAAMTTPAARLREIDRRARTAQSRLLLLGAQGAALFLAFAALLGVARRRDAAALAEQLRGLGATRRQTSLVGLIEVAVPACLGAAAALAIAVAAAAWMAARRDLPGFAGSALPAETLALVAALVAGAVLCEHAAAARPARRRAGLGALEAAALACLAAIVWQALSTGGLDPARVAAGGGPVLLLVPVLSLFAGGVLVARLLPWGFGLAERLARGRSVPVRLALLGLTRGGGLAAAATTFLAVALGAALFALDYRATLHRQLEAQAAFAAGTSWRVVATADAAATSPADAGGSSPADAGGSSPTVAPLTRFSRVTAERPAPVLRARALVSPGSGLEDAREATLLAVPGGRVPGTDGWDPPPELERALRTGARADGPPLAPGAVEVRLRMRTTMPGTIVLELLQPGERFARAELGGAPVGRWARLRAAVPGGARVVGLTLSSPLTPRESTIGAGALEQRVPGRGWSRVDDLRSWQVAPGRFGGQGTVTATPRGIRAVIPESDTPLLRPGYRVPEEIPALVGEPLAREAVDRLLTAMVGGRPLPIRVAGYGARLPTVTHRPDRFVLVDYDTLMAFVTAQRPGAAMPNEAWFAGAPAPRADGRPAAPSGRDESSPRGRDESPAPSGRGESPALPGRLISRAALVDAARRDSLAAGASATLAITAALASVLAAAGLLLAAGSALRAERGELAGWLALGAGPRALARTVRLRVLALYAAGALAAVAGAALALQLVVAIVAVTAGGGVPLPPIRARVDWAGGAALIAATGATAALVAAAAGRLALRRLSVRRAGG